MRVFADSVGHMPFYALVVTIVVCALINVAFLARVNIHGPSAVVPGLKKVSTLTLHKADAPYALAIARRFCHEYFNWTHRGHLRAKARAAFLCDETTADIIMQAAKAKNHFYTLLLVTSNAQPDKATIVEEDLKAGRFVVELQFTLREWQSFLPTQHEMKAQIVLTPQGDLTTRPFLLRVSNYVFTPLSAPEALPYRQTQDDAEEVMWDNLAADGAVMDRQYQLNAPRVKGSIIATEQTEYEVIPTEEWKALLKRSEGKSPTPPAPTVEPDATLKPNPTP